MGIEVVIGIGIGVGSGGAGYGGIGVWAAGAAGGDAGLMNFGRDACDRLWGRADRGSLGGSWKAPGFGRPLVCCLVGRPTGEGFGRLQSSSGIGIGCMGIAGAGAYFFLFEI